ncbi:anti-sigma factor family protein [Kitasatospora sp. NPDC008115]|uniref:anti-sigma factor family protein n=1 Tax=Kitasatospora sp. NPDC008115 TaxID=3364022 RepID=UPI0036EF356B
MTAPLSSPDPAADVHPDVDELADLAEDLLAPADAEALRRHLAGCADCRETVEALAEVRTLLAGAGSPAMPADVAARIDAALAAAAQDDRPAPVPAPAPAPSVRSVTPSASTAPPARPSTATGPGRTGRPRRRRALLLGSAAALLALGLGGAFLSLSPSQRGDGLTTSSAGGPAAAPAAPESAAAKADRAPGGTVYQDERLAAQVRQLLTEAKAATERPVLPVKPSAGAGAGNPSDGSGPPAVPPAEGGEDLAGSSRPASACPPPSTAALLATDHGSYDGAPAELLVHALPGHPDQLDVYLRSPGCALLLHRVVAAG